MGGGKSSTTTQNQQAVTTPTIPNYALGPVQNYFQGVSNYQNSDPASFVTPMNQVQQQAIAGSAGLGQSGAAFGQAAQGAQAAMNSPANTASLASLNPVAQAGFGTLGNPAQVQAPQLGNAATYDPGLAGNASTYQAPSLGNAAQVQAPSLGNAAQVQAPSLGNAAQVQAPSLGNAAQATSQGYQTASLGNAAQAAPVGLSGNITQAQAASLLDNFDAYRNPATQGLVDATLANYDHQAELARGNLVADAARNRGLGGSRYAFQQGAFDADSQRNRALTEAELRNQAFLNAAGLAATDAGYRQQTGLFNASAQNQRDEGLAALNAANNQFNAAQTNQFGLANFDAQNAANQFGASAANQASMFNTGQQNQFSLAGADLAQQADLANMGAQNQFSLAGADLAAQAGMFNAGQQNQFSLAGADLAAQAGMFNAGQQNQFSLADQAARNQAGQFNTGQQNQFALAGADLAQQANLANMGAQNQFGLANFDAQNQLGMFNAGQQNQYGLAEFNAANNMNQFNAAQQDAALQRQLQGSGLLGNLAGAAADTYRADLGTQMDLGNSLWSLQNQYTQAPLTQLQNVGSLLNPGMISPISQQTVTGQTSGRTQESGGGLFNTLLGIGGQLGSAAILASDRRVKRDIVRLGEDPDGLGAYRFNYTWDGPAAKPRYGVMADEVAELRPWALGPTVNGISTVNYEAL